MPDSPQILIQRAAQRFGPFGPAEVLTHHRDRRLLATDLAWSEGMPAWEPLGAVMARLGSPLPATDETGDLSKWIAPVGRSAWAVAAGYFGLLSVLFVFAPAALLCGIMGLRSLRANPGLGGKGRAWFGVAMGAVFSPLLLFGLIAAYLEP